MVHELLIDYLMPKVLYMQLLYQVFLSNIDNLHTVVWFQVILSITGILHLMLLIHSTQKTTYVEFICH